MKPSFPILATLLTLIALPAKAQLYVSYENPSFTDAGIAEYSLSGTSMNPSVVSGLSRAGELGFSGSDLYVLDDNTSTFQDQVGQYDLSGNTIKAAVIPSATAFTISGSNIYAVSGTTVEQYSTSGVLLNGNLFSISGPNLSQIAVSGSNIFVEDTAGTISEYTASGVMVQNSLATVANHSGGLAVSGSNIFAGTFTSAGGGDIAEFSISSGTLEDPSFISGIGIPDQLVVSGSDLYLISTTSTSIPGTSTIGQYMTSGDTLDASLITLTGIGLATGLAIEDVPEPSSWAMMLGGVGFLAWARTRGRRASV